MKNTGRMEEVRRSWELKLPWEGEGGLGGDKGGRDHPSGSFRLWKWSMQAGVWDGGFIPAAQSRARLLPRQRKTCA